MKRNRYLQLSPWLTVIMAASALTRTIAQTGEILLPTATAYQNGDADGNGKSVLIDPFSNQNNPSVFVAGTRYTFGDYSIFRLDPNDSLATTFNLSRVDNQLRGVNSLVYNRSEGTHGVLYAVGYAPKKPQDGNSVNVWKVLKSYDGITWVQDDVFSSKNLFSQATDITTDNNGNVYVCGIEDESNWIVRRKLRATGIWQTVFNVKSRDTDRSPSIYFYPGSTTSPASPPAVFTVSVLNKKWTVLRSQSQGASGTWVSVDDWGLEATAHDIASDSTGNLYAIGCRGLNGYHATASSWLVRLSSDGGDTWVPHFEQPGPLSWAKCIAVDQNDNILVTGVINPTSQKPHWYVIRCSEPQNPSSWSASFNQPVMNEAGFAKGYGITTDAVGHIFTAGVMWDWTDANQFFYDGLTIGVRRIAIAHTPTP